MFANVPQIIRQFKQRWSGELEDEAIRLACREAGHTWRERELGPVATVKSEGKGDILICCAKK